MAPKSTNKRTRRDTRSQASATEQPIPPPIPQTLQPPYARFISPEAEERFKKIKGYGYVGERGFDLVSLTCYPTFDSTLRRRGWENLNNFITERTNLSIVLEFCANASVQSDQRFRAVVRGRPVEFRGSDINRALGLPVPQECDVQRMRKPANWPKDNADWDTMLFGLMREGKTWKRSQPDRNPQRLNVVDLLPVPKAWAYFILATIVYTSCTYEMITNRALILLALLNDDDEIDVGELIAHNLKEMVVSKNKTVGHGCLINLLCKKAGVSSEPSDLEANSQGPINETAMMVYESSHRKYMEKLAEHGGVPQPEAQLTPQMQQGECSQQPHLSHLEAYMYGATNWMRYVSSRMYVDPSYFVPEFAATVEQYRQPPRGSFQRFQMSEDNMNDYFQQQRDMAAQRERDIRANFIQERDEAEDSFVTNLFDPSDLFRQ